MKEEKLKKLLQKSKMETSHDFTKNLMVKLEQKQESKKTLVWSFKAVSATTVFLMVALGYLTFALSGSSLKLLNLHIHVLKTPTMLVFLLFCLVILSYLISLNESQKHSKKEL